MSRRTALTVAVVTTAVGVAALVRWRFAAQSAGKLEGKADQSGDDPPSSSAPPPNVETTPAVTIAANPQGGNLGDGAGREREKGDGAQLVERRDCSDPTRGRGLFANAPLKRLDCALKVRPALTLIFEPYSSEVCLACNKITTPAGVSGSTDKRCRTCKRFAVCGECDAAFNLFEWHKEGECKRWMKLPEGMRQQRQLDVQFMLVRYRAAMDKDWSDDPNVKEPLNSLVDLQANMINLPETQMKGIRGLGNLIDLSPEKVITLMMMIRTNAGSIHLPNVNKVGCALSSNLSALNHNCDPNAVARVLDGCLVVGMTREVEKDDELTISYVDTAAPLTERQAILRNHYQFACSCERCVREATAGL